MMMSMFDENLEKTLADFLNLPIFSIHSSKLLNLYLWSSRYSPTHITRCSMKSEKPPMF